MQTVTVTTNKPTKSKKDISEEERLRRAQQSADDKAAAGKPTKKSKKAKSKAGKTTQGGAKKAGVNPLMAGALQHELDLDLSIAHNLQTLFNPRAGAHRPFAEGYEETALVSWESTFTISGFTATNNAVTFAFVPWYTTAIDQVSWAFCPGTALVNPITDNLGFAYPGPFRAVNPSKTSRVISFEVIITPTGPNMNLAGAGCMAYYAKNAGSTQAAGGALDWSTASGAFEKQKYNLTFAGSDKTVAHWLPVTSETQLSNITATAVSTDLSHSAIVGYYIAPTGVAADESFRVDVRQVIEYVPSDAYYPYVGVSSSNMLPTTDHYVSKVFMANANPLIFGRYDDWFSLCQTWTPLGGHSYVQSHHGKSTARAALGRGAPGNRDAFEQLPIQRADEPQNLRADLDREEEEKEGPPIGPRLREVATGVIRTAINVSKAVAGDPTGLIDQVVDATLGNETEIVSDSQINLEMPSE